MNRTIVAKYAMRLALGLAVLALTASPSFAQTTIDLCASDGSVTIAGEVIPIWGYIDTTISGVPCTTGLATLPGPVLTVPEGTLTINLTNALGVPVSVFIPGLAKDAGDPLAPVVGTDSQGRERLSSFDKTVVTGGTLGYTWVATEGTQLYHSGTDIRTQVPMGLSGALVVTGTGYPAVADEEVLVFSQIDPSLNNDPGGFGGARVSTWDPQFFLINGQAFEAGSPPDPIAININEDVLLRFVNAGIETFVPTFDGGLYMDLIAEDGNLSPAVFSQYGLALPAAKTVDAIVNIDSVGTYALWDRSLHLTNRAVLGGGMLAFFVADVPPPNSAPVADPDTYDVVEFILHSEPAPGVLVNDSDPDDDPLTLNTTPLVGPSNGSLTLFADGSFDYTSSVAAPAVDSFTYEVCDPEPLCSPGVVTINIVSGADFGDAPDPTYPTLLASDGARHAVGGALFLGAAADSEPDGQPSAGADSDDLDGTDDEDGVVFASAFELGLDASITLEASAAGLLNAWIDYNADGDWDDAGEQIFTDTALAAGTNNLLAPVPIDATLGATFARFRVDSTGGLAPTGAAADGEVEDYALVIGSSAELGVNIDDSPDPVTDGGRLSYFLQVGNNGGLDATGVVLTDTLDVNVSFVSASLPGCSETGGLVTCNLDTVPAGSSTAVEIQVDVAVGFTGAISNTAVLTLNEGDPIPANNTDIEATTVVVSATYIFSDGFETGGTIRWSSTVGP